MQEGEVVSWFKHEGDQVSADEPLAEIEAAKVTSEVTAPAAGVLARILVGEGETAAVREPLAVITTDQQAPPRPRPEPAASPAAAPPVVNTPTGQDGASGPVPARRRASPRVRRLAHELGVDLDAVTGGGPGGAITEADLRAAGAGPAPGSTVPLSGTRRTIARRMRESLQTMAPVTLTSEADVTDLVAARLANPPAVTYTAYLVRAAAAALAGHHWMNARLEGDHVRLLDDVDIGVAVSIDGGLVVPVVRGADHKDLARIAADIAELSGKARDGTLRPEEVTGGTFTITNLGMYGIDAFTPIINPPEAATLGAGRIADRPVPDGSGGVRWRRAMVLSLTFDHRLVDGAPAAEFLQSIRAGLAGPAPS
jgi:pyruvate dehydrogenase E2 component (dihydrolipoamide acetyltransferase)